MEVLLPSKQQSRGSSPCRPIRMIKDMINELTFEERMELERQFEKKRERMLEKKIEDLINFSRYTPNLSGTLKSRATILDEIENYFKKR